MGIRRWLRLGAATGTVCRITSRAAGIGLLLLAWQHATAGPLTVNNFSFESPALSSPGVSSPIPGWTGSGGVFRPLIGVHVAAVPQGSQVGYILGAASMVQDLGVAVQVGLSYQLDVYVGTQINFSGAGYLVELLDGGSTVFASASGVRAMTDPFVLVSASGVGAGTGNVRVRLTSTNGQPLFDNVQVQTLDSPVPEPSTFVVTGLGLVLLSRPMWRMKIRG